MTPIMERYTLFLVFVVVKKDQIYSVTKLLFIVLWIEEKFSQLNDLTKEMELEARGSDAKDKKLLLERLADHKKAITSLRSEYDRSKEKSQRSELIGKTSTEHRQKVLDINDK